MPDATRSPAELAASESTATDPVTSQMANLATIRTVFDPTDRRAAERLARESACIRRTVVI